MDKLKILVVDDSLITSNKIADILTKAGHEVVSTPRTGKAAILEYKKYSPQIVTMDITMPDMNGIEVTKSLIEYDSNALIIMITSHGQEMLLLDAIDAGAKGYLIKPVNSERLLSAIEEIYKNYGVSECGE